MKLIIGLGNTGKEYEKTRHNAGFVVLDEIRNAFGFFDFSENKKFNAEVSEGLSTSLLPPGEGAQRADEGEKIILAKPLSFMNLSGQVVQTIMSFYKISPKDITIIHDDLDIALGEYKVSADSSSAGHNGVQSIFDSLGTQKIKRIRVGIEGAEKKAERIIPGDVFVLQNFSDEELATVKNLSTEIAKTL